MGRKQRWREVKEVECTFVKCLLAPTSATLLDPDTLTEPAQSVCLLLVSTAPPAIFTFSSQS